MTDLLTPPSAAWADEGLALVRATESTGVADHSIRTFQYARLVAEAEGMTNDADHREDLVYAACLLHDLGLGTEAAGAARFEVEGADAAAALLTRHGVPATEVDQVWEAIALHSSHGIADRLDRLGSVAYLTYRGVFIDAGSSDTTGLDHEGLRRIRTALPRRVGDRSVTDAIIDHARRSPAAVPKNSLGAILLHEQELAEQAGH